MAKNDNLPVVIGKNLGKGMLVFRADGGFNIAFCWLKKHYDSGEKFELDDIRKIQTVLHFCDLESVEQTMKALKWIMKQWKVKDGKEKEKSRKASAKKTETEGAGKDRP